MVEKGLDVNALAGHWVDAHEFGHHQFKARTSSRTALQIASSNGASAAVKVLTEAGADIGIKAEEGLTALHLAARDGHDSVVMILLEAEAGVSIRADRGLTPLHLAALHGHDSVVTILLRAGADINTPDDLGWTALHHVADNGLKEMVLVLLEKGADINARANGGETALHVVARMARAPLKKRGRRRNYQQLRQLSLEKQAQDAEMTRLLLKQGASVNAANLDGLTPLHLAAREGNQAITDLLLQNEADVDATDKSGLTALHWVASKEGRISYFGDYEEHEKVAVMLLEKGASIGARDKAGRTPLFLAAAGEHGSMCCILLAKGGDGATMRAAEPSDETYPKMDELRRATLQVSWHKIMEHTTASNKQGSSYYEESDEDGEDKGEEEGQQDQQAEREALRLLFEMAAFATPEANPSRERFIDACNKGYDGVVSMLLANDVDASITKEDKELAYISAATSGHEAIVRALIESGVNVEPESSDGRSALQ